MDAIVFERNLLLTVLKERKRSLFSHCSQAVILKYGFKKALAE